MNTSIMLQGTSSNVGKSILTAALCRIFKQDGYRPVPFKAQNMALNSYVTKSGGEMGRAQVVQAEAAGIEPEVEMNPVLLKPTGNSSSQIIILGKPVGNMSASEYHQGYSLKALGVVESSLKKLMNDFDMVVIEGAGSPAEVNLKAHDIVNMRVAKMFRSPVLLIADIDRGGALASVVGTLELLEPEERDLVQGIIINKFRGDIKLLEPALTFLEEKTGKAIIGVVPYLDKHGIDDEDSVALDSKNTNEIKDLNIVVIRLPKISNFTDFDALAREDDVNLKYVQSVEELKDADLIIIPGTKNTTDDLLFLKESGLESSIIRMNKTGTVVIGICGGYQMLGAEILDPQHCESNLDGLAGLNLLPIKTTFEAEKVTRQVIATAKNNSFLDMNFSAPNLTGYEIHSGITEYITNVEPAFFIDRGDGNITPDGVVQVDKLVMGTYLHGIFDNDDFRRAVLNQIRQIKGLNPLDKSEQLTTAQKKELAYERLAKTVREALDMEKVYQVMGLKNNE